MSQMNAVMTIIFTLIITLALASSSSSRVQFTSDSDSYFQSDNTPNKPMSMPGGIGQTKPADEEVQEIANQVCRQT